MVIALVVGFVMPKSFLPERNQGDFTLALELPAGTPLEQTKETAVAISELLVSMDEVATVYAQVGETERTLAALKEYTAANTVRIRVLLHPSRGNRRRTEAVRDSLKQNLTSLSGATYVFRDEGIGLGEILASNEASFTLGIIAEKPEDALVVAEELLPRLREVEGLTDVGMDRVLGNPTVEITLNREKALRYGLEPDRLARELRARIQGVVATTFNEVEQRIDIAVRLSREQSSDLVTVLSSPVMVAPGKTVPLGIFVDQSEGRPVREVVRNNQRRQITITADVRGRSLGRIWKAVNGILDEMDLPAGVAFMTGGEQEEINQSFRDLGWALLLSALLVNRSSQFSRNPS